MTPTNQTIGPMGKADFCGGCGALVPNSWGKPYDYVHRDGKHYCNLVCASMEPIEWAKLQQEAKRDVQHG